MKLNWLTLATLWTARTFGLIWILVSSFGFIFSGGKIELLAAVSPLSLAALTFAPASAFGKVPTMHYLLLMVCIGLIGPVKLVIEQLPDFAMAYVPALQTLPLVLFAAVLGMSYFRGQST